LLHSLLDTALAPNELTGNPWQEAGAPDLAVNVGNVPKAVMRRHGKQTHTAVTRRSTKNGPVQRLTP